MHRFTSRDLMVSVLPSSAGVDMLDCATACTNEPTRDVDCATACTNEPTRDVDCVTACTNEPTKAEDCATACTNEPTKADMWSDLATDADLAVLQGDLAAAQR